MDRIPYITVLMFKTGNLHKSSRILLNKIIGVIEEYEEMGYMLTVRQIYYQLVSRLIVKNINSMYQRTSKLVTIGRMLGEIDWDSIVDRARTPRMPGQYDSMAKFVDAVKNSYRKYRWSDQDHYVEVIVEKDALAGILEPVTRKYHVSLLANKGYSSASAIHELAMRMNYQNIKDKECHILYLGDHDPSGIDMVRDIKDRLAHFECFPEMERIALTMDQIKEYKPPPNPAKISDPRSDKYRQLYGNESWELDALDPKALVDLVEYNITKYLDVDKYNRIIQLEQEERDHLDAAVARM